MSNKQFRTAPSEKPAPAPAPAPDPGPVSARDELVKQAVARLFEARGGTQLVKAARLAEICVEGAQKCREADNRRLEEEPMAMRAKGERPIYTVSEGRLHMRDMVRYSQEAARLQERCERDVREAIEMTPPRDERELRVLLERLTCGAKVEFMLPENIEAMETAGRELAATLKPEALRELAQISVLRDADRLQAFVERHPPEMRVKIFTALGLHAA